MDQIAQARGGQDEFFLGDALGSMRQLTDATAGVILAQSYDPYGNVIGTIGAGATISVLPRSERPDYSWRHHRLRYGLPDFGSPQASNAGLSRNREKGARILDACGRNAYSLSMHPGGSIC